MNWDKDDIAKLAESVDKQHKSHIYNVEEKEKVNNMDRKYEIEVNKDILINETDDNEQLEITLTEENDISILISNMEVGLGVCLTDKQVNNLIFLLDTMLKQKNKEEKVDLTPPTPTPTPTKGANLYSEEDFAMKKKKDK